MIRVKDHPLKGPLSRAGYSIYVMRKTYDIVEEPLGDLYRALLDYCNAHAQIVLLVLREVDWIETPARTFLEQFRSILIAQEQATEWPGTKLTSGTATIFQYHITFDLIDYLKTKVEGLYEWQQPERLEDLCFLRQDKSTLLATIAHEKDAYMELTSKEHKDLLRLLPALHVVRHERDSRVIKREIASIE